MQHQWNPSFLCTWNPCIWSDLFTNRVSVIHSMNSYRKFHLFHGALLGRKNISTRGTWQCFGTSRVCSTVDPCCKVMYCRKLTRACVLCPDEHLCPAAVCGRQRAHGRPHDAEEGAAGRQLRLCRALLLGQGPGHRLRLSGWHLEGEHYIYPLTIPHCLSGMHGWAKDQKVLCE